MNEKYDHARELFSDAIDILATSAKNIHYRLYEVWEILFHLKKSEVPEELQDDWDEIKSVLKKTKIDKISNELIINEKKLNIRNVTGEKIAKKIMIIYYELHFSEKY